jgi:hypothetical protein
VTNLSSLSVVKQRLAALERNASQESSISLGRPGSSESGFSNPDAQQRLSTTLTPGVIRSRASPLVYGTVNRTRDEEDGTGTTTPVSGLPATTTARDESHPLGLTVPLKSEGTPPLDLGSSTRTLSTTASSPGTWDENANHGKKGKEKALYDKPVDALPRSAGRDDPTHLDGARTEIEQIARGVRGIQSVLGGPPDAQPNNITVHQIALGLDHRLNGASDLLKEVKERLESMESRIVSEATRKTSNERDTPAAAIPRRAGSSGGGGGGGASRIPLKKRGTSGSIGTSTPPSLVDAKEVRELLREIKGHLSTELPALSAKMADLSARDIGGGGEGHDVIPGLTGERPLGHSRRQESQYSLTVQTSLDVDLIPIKAKMEELLTVVGDNREDIGIAQQELREEVRSFALFMLLP